MQGRSQRKRQVSNDSAVEHGRIVEPDRRILDVVHASDGVMTKVMFTRSSHVPLAEHQRIPIGSPGWRTNSSDQFLTRQPNNGTDALQQNGVFV
jgi:hypothetical protein